MKFTKFVLAAIAATAVFSASAGDFYSGAGANFSQLRTSAAELKATSLDKTGTGINLIAGYNYNKNVSLELGLASVEGISATYGSKSSSVKGLDTSFAVVGRYDVTPRIQLLGKAGVAYTQLKADGSIGKQGSFLYGIGAETPIAAHVSLRGEFERLGNYGGSSGALNRFDLTAVYNY